MDSFASMARWRIELRTVLTRVMLWPALAACEPSRPDGATAGATATAPSPHAETPPSATSPSPSPAPPPALAPLSPEGASNACASASDASPLVSLEGTNVAERAALAAVRRRVEELLERPADYHASLQHAGDVVIVDLWRSAGLREAGCERPDAGIHRTLTYDVARREIIATRWW